MTVKTVGLDLAKDVFQVHCVSATGRKIINKKIKRAKLLSFFETLLRCVVGMEACGSSHYWGRELPRLGDDARLMPAAYVKPYMKRSKTDAAEQKRSAKLYVALPCALLRSNRKTNRLFSPFIGRKTYLSGNVHRS